LSKLGLEKSFKAASSADSKTLPWKALHIATILQEGLLLFNIITARFKLGAGSKVKKGDPVRVCLFSRL
jgi:N-terminal acetyltransferase B complex non-catalytic subunit